MPRKLKYDWSRPSDALPGYAQEGFEKVLDENKEEIIFLPKSGGYTKKGTAGIVMMGNTFSKIVGAKLKEREAEYLSEMELDARSDWLDKFSPKSEDRRGVSQKVEAKKSIVAPVRVHKKRKIEV